MNITVSPVFLNIRHSRGWNLRLSGPGVRASCFWGGNPKDTPAAAVDSYANAIREAFPTASIRFLPASPAQIKRSLKA